MPRWWVFALRLAWPAALAALVIPLAALGGEGIAGCWILVAGLFIVGYPFFVTWDWAGRRFSEQERWSAALPWLMLAYASAIAAALVCLSIALPLALLFGA